MIITIGTLRTLLLLAKKEKGTLLPLVKIEMLLSPVKISHSNKQILKLMILFMEISIKIKEFFLHLISRLVNKNLGERYINLIIAIVILVYQLRRHLFRNCKLDLPVEAEEEVREEA